MAGKRRFTVKKKLYITIFLILIIPFIYSGTTSLLSQTELDSSSSITESFVQDYGSIETHFCPQEDCETILTNFLASAQESIHCALFEVNLPKVQQVLSEKSSLMDVRVVTDKDYLDEFNHSFVKEDSWGLMHNKFCIVDSKKISTGSMNPTLNGATKNDNNFLLIESQILAQNYDDEFQEMWSGTFKKGDPVKNSHVMLSETKIQNYFCPEDHCTERIKGELAKAKESIHFMTFSFTSQEISNILLLKKLDNLTIRGVMEARQVTKDSVYQQLLYQGIDVVKDQNKNNMHHKVFIIDGKTVITGSMNPTGGGNTRNDENILIIEDENIAQLFLKEWMEVYD